MTTKIKISGLLLLLALLATAFFFVHRGGKKEKATNKSVIVLHTFKTSTGWGYQIDIDGKNYIYQPFIPAIQTRVSFETAKAAKAVGMIVVNKIMKGESPALTKADLKTAGLNLKS
jgi:hypothetical protein